MSKDSYLKNIPIDNVTEPVDQVRTVIVFEGLQQLAESIKAKGIIQPLVVLRKGDKYEVTDGHRRYLAAKIAGLQTLPCIVRGYNLEEADIIKLHANAFRENVNPVDEGKFFVRVHEKHNLSYGEIAKLYTRSDSYVLARVNLLTGDSRILAALEAGQLNFSQALEIGRAADDNIRLELLRITVESGATVDTLRVMRHDYESRQSSGDSAVVQTSPEGGSYPEMKHLITCPFCVGSYPVNMIYPISACKTCYDNILKKPVEGAQ